VARAGQSAMRIARPAVRCGSQWCLVRLTNPSLTPLDPTGTSALIHRRAFRLLLAFVCARMCLLVIPFLHPEGGVLIDSGGYLGLARLLVSAGNYVHPSGQDLIWPPGYPLLVAAASLWQEPSPFAVAALQLLLTGGLALVLVWIGSRLGGQRAGLAAGWLYAISPNAAFWSMTVMSETAFAVMLVFGVVAFVRWLDSPRLARALAIGLMLGSASLIRPAGSLLLILWALMVFLADRRTHGGRLAAGSAVLVLAGGMVILVPWMMRNKIVRGEWVFSSVASKTFYGYNVASVLAEARGIPRNEAVLEIGATGDEWGDSLRVLTAYPGIFLSQQWEGVLRTSIGVESGVWARQLGLSHEYQGSFGVLSALRAGRPGEAFEKVREQLSSPATAPHALLFLLGAGYTLALYGILGAALLHAGHWPPSARRVAVLALITVAYIVLVPGAAGQARFRVSVEPLLALGAALYWARAGDSSTEASVVAAGTAG